MTAHVRQFVADVFRFAVDRKAELGVDAAEAVHGIAEVALMTIVCLSQAGHETANLQEAIKAMTDKAAEEIEFVRKMRLQARAPGGSC